MKHISRLPILVGLVLLMACGSVRAMIPEPDNVLYGLIAIGTNLVTRARTNVFVEVQRPTGEVLSRYQMGHDSSFANFYVVTLALESVDAPMSASASTAGTPVKLVVKELVQVPRRAEVVRYETNLVVLDRGRVQRLDFGNVQASVTDGFADWEAANGLPEDSELIDTDGDGVINRDEYLAGTDPRDPASVFKLSIAPLADGVEVSFPTLSVRGKWYASGAVRYYSLESSTNLSEATFRPVSGQGDVVGNDQRYRHAVRFDGTNPPPAFYRARIRISP